MDNKIASMPFVAGSVVVGLLLGGAALWGANKSALGLFHDDGVYAVVAKAIYQGDGYRIISLPSALPQTKYPFLYSYLLSWLWAWNPAFPQNILILKGLNAAVLVAIFFLAIVFYRRVFPTAKIGALVFAILVCSNPIVFTYTDYVVSDLLFVLLALAALVVSRTSADLPSSTGKLLRLAAITGLACLTRLAAAPLVLAGAIQSFFGRGWRGAGYFTAAVLLLVGPWILWVYSNHDAMAHGLLSYYSGYDFSGAGSNGTAEGFANHGSVITSNSRYLLRTFDVLYLLPLMSLLIPLVAGLTATGMAVSTHREDIFAWSFFLSSLALLLVWPFHPGRYVAPLAPLLMFFLFRGMATVECWINSVGGEYSMKRFVAKIAWCPALLLLLLNGVWMSSYLLIDDVHTTRGVYGSRVPYGWRGFEDSFAWIRQNTKTDARLASAYDPMYFLYTGRRAIRPALHRPATYFYPYGHAKPDVGSVGEIKAELEKMRIDYLIIDPLDGYAEGKATIQLLDELVTSYGDKAKKVFTSADGKHRIYALMNE